LGYRLDLQPDDPYLYKDALEWFVQEAVTLGAYGKDGQGVPFYMSISPSVTKEKQNPQIAVAGKCRFCPTLLQIKKELKITEPQCLP